MSLRPCIYALTDPDGAVRYIGQAKDFRKRLSGHMRPSGSSGDTHRAKWLKALRAKGQSPGWFIVCYADDLDEAETFWIRRLRRAGLSLVNTADGGKSHTHMVRAKADSGWAGKQTPIQRMLCALSFSVRSARKRGDETSAQHLERRGQEVRDKLDQVRRVKGAAGIEAVNRALANKWEARSACR